VSNTLHNHYTTAPGMPQSLITTSVSVSNITIQWDRVNCQERNGPTDSYNANSSERHSQIVIGTRDGDRILTVSGLPPRTNYTFEVQASSPVINVHGAFATITVSTTPPESEKNN
jgi:hypothetical protein